LGLGVNALTPFSSSIVICKPFQPSLIFESKAGAYPSGLLWDRPVANTKIRLERLARCKRSSLFSLIFRNVL
jgi:hypothetical protein